MKIPKFAVAIFMKAHSQYELALIHVRKSLKLYSLSQLSLAYTENEPSSINAAMETVLDDGPSDDPDTQIVVGFYLEWNIEVSISEATL